ncbi:MAG: hypothetical protein H6745_25490 [Deltaproteobacteria bacterium]|nr:hypothetical protein [Deltaproteobacteria bacterium]
MLARATLASSLALLALLALAPRPAAAAPGVLPVQGYLTDAAGAPVDGPVDLTFTLVDADADPTDVWTDTLAGVSVSAGFFTAYLGAGALLDLNLFGDHQDLALVVQVGDDDPMNPVPIGVAAYAAFADACGDAASLQGASVADLTYAAGPGLSLVGGTFAVVQSTIEGWARGVCYDSAPELTAALDGRYLLGPAATDALGGVFAGQCPPGQVVGGIDGNGALACVDDLDTDTDTDTTYTAGIGVTISAANAIALATPTATTLGGVYAEGCGAGRVVTAIDADGHITCSVPPGPGPRTLVLHASAFQPWPEHAQFLSYGLTGDAVRVTDFTVPRLLRAPLPLPTGARVTQLACTIFDAATTGYALVSLYDLDGAANATPDPLLTVGTSLADSRPDWHVATAGLDDTLAAGHFAYLTVELGATSNVGLNLRFRGCAVTYTPPAN